eukprot:s266_g31.t1
MAMTEPLTPLPRMRGTLFCPIHFAHEPNILSLLWGLEPPMQESSMRWSWRRAANAIPRHDSKGAGPDFCFILSPVVTAAEVKIPLLGIDSDC